MSEIVTQPHNGFLLESFRAFQAEGLSLDHALAMTAAHVAHGVGIEQAKALGRIADAAERIAKLADPVVAGEFLAFLKASETKRTENKEARKDDEAKEAFQLGLGLSVPRPLA